MKPGLLPGVHAEIHVEVTEAMCPEFHGVLVHRVYSTWSLAHHMEVAARTVLAPYLDEDEEGLGTHLSVDHLSITPMGKTVRIRAECVEVGSHRVVCSVQAFDGDRLIGHGQQVQRVLPKDVIRKLVERYSPDGETDRSVHPS